MRKISIAIIALLLAGLFVAVALKVHGQSTPKRFQLNAQQEIALRKADDALQNIRQQFEAVTNQRQALLTGFAASTPELATLGWDWQTKYKLIKVGEATYFEEKTDSEVQAEKGSGNATSGESK